MAAGNLALPRTADRSIAQPNSTGSLRGPRTVPSDQVTVAAGSSRNSGMRREPFLQRDRDLHAGEVRADAAVDAEPERRVAVLLAVDHHAVGIREHRRIAVRRREREQHHLARLERAAVDGRLLDDLARHRDRRVGAQEFLDRGRDQLRLGGEAPAVLRHAAPDARSTRRSRSRSCRCRRPAARRKRAEQMILGERLRRRSSRSPDS